jgi:hypothetical protein
VDHVALHLFIPVCLEIGLTRFGRKFNVLHNKSLARNADNGRVRGIKMNPGSQREDSLGDVSILQKHNFSAYIVRSPLWKELLVVLSVHALFLSPLIIFFPFGLSTGHFFNWYSGVVNCLRTLGRRDRRFESY